MLDFKKYHLVLSISIMVKDTLWLTITTSNNPILNQFPLHERNLIDTINLICILIGI